MQRIEYDHAELDRTTGRCVPVHYVLHPVGGDREIRTTADNLRLNPRVTNVVITQEGD